MIMPISTGGIGKVDISQGTAAKAKSKAEEKAMDAFASLMNMASPVENNQIDVAEEMGVSQVENTSEVDYTNQYEDSYEVDNSTYETRETDAPSDSVSVNEAKENSSVNEVTGNTDNVEDAVDNATTALNDLKESIMAELNITEEEFNNLLENMNLNLEDLMKVDNLKNFILASQDSTKVDLLINENLSTLVNDLVNKLQNILQDNNITDVSEFIAFVEDNSQVVYAGMTEEQVVTVSNINVDSKANIEENVSDIADDTVVTNKNDSDVDIKITTTEEQVQTESTKTNTASQSGQEGYQTNQDTPENTIISNLNQAINNVANANVAEGIPAYVTQVNEADVVRQIIDSIKVNLSKDTTAMEVQLNPEHLGKVQINVASKDGIITAQIVAETEAAKNAMENSIAVLKETFNNQEIKVEAIEVMVATSDFFNRGQDADFNNDSETNTSNSVGGINLNGDIVEEELTEEEQLQVEMMRQQGNSVSYSI